jgi:hypothetical protein
MWIDELLESYQKLTYGLIVLNGVLVSVITYQLVKNEEYEKRLDKLENIENSRMARMQDNWDRARVRDSDIMLDADD